MIGTPWQLRMLPAAVEVEDPGTVLWGKKLRIGSGRINTTGESLIPVFEFWYCLTLGSFELLFRVFGLQGWHGRHWFQHNTSLCQRCS